MGSAAAGSQAQAAWRLYVCRSQLLVQHSADLVPWWLNGIALPGTALPCRRGRFNAVMFWYKLHLYGDVYLSTGPEAVAGGGWAGGWVWRGCSQQRGHWPHVVTSGVSILPVSFLLVDPINSEPPCPAHLPTCPPYTRLQACAACSLRCSTSPASCRWMRGLYCPWWHLIT